MKWAEMIRVRSSTEGISDLYSGLPQVISGIRKNEMISEALLLLHALYVGDLAVILIWTGTGKPLRSPEGICLANNFEEYGTVEHSVWLIASEELAPNSSHHKS